MGDSQVSIHHVSRSERLYTHTRKISDNEQRTFMRPFNSIFGSTVKLTFHRVPIVDRGPSHKEIRFSLTHGWISSIGSRAINDTTFKGEWRADVSLTEIQSK